MISQVDLHSKEMVSMKVCWSGDRKGGGTSIRRHLGFHITNVFIIVIMGRSRINVIL